MNTRNPATVMFVLMPFIVMSSMLAGYLIYDSTDGQQAQQLVVSSAEEKPQVVTETDGGFRVNTVVDNITMQGQGKLVNDPLSGGIAGTLDGPTIVKIMPSNTTDNENETELIINK